MKFKIEDYIKVVVIKFFSKAFLNEKSTETKNLKKGFLITRQSDSDKTS